MPLPAEPPDSGHISLLYKDLKKIDLLLKNETLTPIEKKDLEQEKTRLERIIDEKAILVTPDWQKLVHDLLLGATKNTFLLHILTHSRLKEIRDKLINAGIDLKKVRSEFKTFEKFIKSDKANSVQKSLLTKYKKYEYFIFYNISEKFRQIQKEEFIDDYEWAMAQDVGDEEIEQPKELTFDKCCIELGIDPEAARDIFFGWRRMPLEKMITEYNNRFRNPLKEKDEKEFEDELEDLIEAEF